MAGVAASSESALLSSSRVRFRPARIKDGINRASPREIRSRREMCRDVPRLPTRRGARERERAFKRLAFGATWRRRGGGRRSRSASVIGCGPSRAERGACEGDEGESSGSGGDEEGDSSGGNGSSGRNDRADRVSARQGPAAYPAIGRKIWPSAAAAPPPTRLFRACAPARHSPE